MYNASNAINQQTECNMPSNALFNTKLCNLTFPSYVSNNQIKTIGSSTPLGILSQYEGSNGEYIIQNVFEVPVNFSYTNVSNLNAYPPVDSNKKPYIAQAVSLGAVTLNGITNVNILGNFLGNGYDPANKSSCCAGIENNNRECAMCWCP